MTSELAPLHAVVVGGGTMGVGIAYVLALSGAQVGLVDADLNLATAAVARVLRLVDGAVERDRLTAEQADAVRPLLRPLGRIEDADAGVDTVIEAVPERADLKIEVLRTAERALAPALLASNTSGISIDELAAALEAPARFLGLHFFNPVWAMQLVEVVVGAATGQDTRERALALVDRIGKTAVVVADAPGFATSRLGVALGLEAIRMVEQGVAEPADIDRAMVLGYRHPVGPLRLTDLVGLDVRLDIARNLAAAYGPRFDPPQLLVDMVAEGRLGKKVGRGFYEWPEG
jgi:3-hydroxybutyryl-CoA dehydrogenase